MYFQYKVDIGLCDTDQGFLFDFLWLEGMKPIKYRLTNVLSRKNLDNSMNLGIFFACKCTVKVHW